MKYIKTYEGLLSAFGLSSVEKMYWTDTEENELKELGFTSEEESSHFGFHQDDFEYKSPSDDIKITVSKYGRHMPGMEGMRFRYYLVKYYEGDKVKKTKFKSSYNDLENLIEFIKTLIPEADVDVKKYNL